MPTYEYKCSACGHAFERFHAMSAVPVKRCPECGKAKVKRLMGTGAGLIFKGSGFYITDYRDSGYKEQAKADAAPAAGSDGKSEGKSDTKSDAKPAAKAESKPADSKSAGGTPPAESKPAAPAKSETPTASKSAAKPTGRGKR